VIFSENDYDIFFVIKTHNEVVYDYYSQ